MRSSTSKSHFVLKSKIDKAIHSAFPLLWIPLYSMVSFTRIPLHKVA